MIAALTDSSALLDFPAFRPEMAFPLLTDDMVQCIRSYASEVMEPAGTSIFSRGQHETEMFVVLEGTVNIYTGDENNDIKSVVDLTQHQFTGELNMLDDHLASQARAGVILIGHDGDAENAEATTILNVQRLSASSGFGTRSRLFLLMQRV